MWMMELSAMKDTPGFPNLLTALIHTQIKHLVDQLSEFTDTHAFFFSTSPTDLPRLLGSTKGLTFLQEKNIGTQFEDFLKEETRQVDSADVEDRGNQSYESDKFNIEHLCSNTDVLQEFNNSDNVEHSSNSNLSDTFHGAENDFKQIIEEDNAQKCDTSDKIIKNSNFEAEADLIEEVHNELSVLNENSKSCPVNKTINTLILKWANSKQHLDRVPNISPQEYDKLITTPTSVQSSKGNLEQISKSTCNEISKDSPEICSDEQSDVINDSIEKQSLAFFSAERITHKPSQNNLSDKSIDNKDVGQVQADVDEDYYSAINISDGSNISAGNDEDCLDGENGDILVTPEQEVVSPVFDKPVNKNNDASKKPTQIYHVVGSKEGKRSYLTVSEDQDGVKSNETLNEPRCKRSLISSEEDKLQSKSSSFISHQKKNILFPSEKIPSSVKQNSKFKQTELKLEQKEVTLRQLQKNLKPEYLKCKTCKKVLRGLKELKEHEYTHTKKFQCFKCDELMEDREVFRDHVKNCKITADVIRKFGGIENILGNKTTKGKKRMLGTKNKVCPEKFACREGRVSHERLCHKFRKSKAKEKRKKEINDKRKLEAVNKMITKESHIDIINNNDVEADNEEDAIGGANHTSLSIFSIDTDDDSDDEGVDLENKIYYDNEEFDNMNQQQQEQDLVTRSNYKSHRKLGCFDGGLVTQSQPPLNDNANHTNPTILDKNTNDDRDSEDDDFEKEKWMSLVLLTRAPRCRKE